MKLLFAMLLCSVLTLATGCVDTVDGRSTPGVLVTKDKIIKRFDRNVPQVLTATRAVLTRNGKLMVDNIAANTLEARINEREVWVRVSAVEPKLTEVTVQARSGMAADIEMAADISTQIAVQLTQVP